MVDEPKPKKRRPSKTPDWLLNPGVKPGYEWVEFPRSPDEVRQVPYVNDEGRTVIAESGWGQWRPIDLDAKAQGKPETPPER